MGPLGLGPLGLGPLGLGPLGLGPLGLGPVILMTIRAKREQSERAEASGSGWLAAESERFFLFDPFSGECYAAAQKLLDAVGWLLGSERILPWPPFGGNYAAPPVFLAVGRPALVLS